MKQDLKIHRVEGDVMLVNSYLLESDEGVVVIDAQLTVSDALKVRRAVDALQKPLAGVVITHAHPDHYAGLSTLLDGRQIPTFSTAGVQLIIARDDEMKSNIVGPMMGSEWPSSREFPQTVVEDGEILELAGLRLLVKDLGPAESPHDSVWYLEGTPAVFIGDLAYNQMHAYLADGYHTQWVDWLRKLERDTSADSVLYSGHGELGDRRLLSAQRTYVERFVEIVRRELSSNPELRKDRVVSAMRELVAGDQLLFLMELSIEPLAAKLLADAK